MTSIYNIINIRSNNSFNNNNNNNNISSNNSISNNKREREDNNCNDSNEDSNNKKNKINLNKDQHILEEYKNKLFNDSIFSTFLFNQHHLFINPNIILEGSQDGQQLLLNNFLHLDKPLSFSNIEVTRFWKILEYINQDDEENLEFYDKLFTHYEDKLACHEEIFDEKLVTFFSIIYHSNFIALKSFFSINKITQFEIINKSIKSNYNNFLIIIKNISNYINISLSDGIDNNNSDNSNNNNNIYNSNSNNNRINNPNNKLLKQIKLFNFLNSNFSIPLSTLLKIKINFKLDYNDLFENFNLKKIIKIWKFIIDIKIFTQLGIEPKDNNNKLESQLQLFTKEQLKLSIKSLLELRDLVFNNNSGGINNNNQNKIINHGYQNNKKKCLKNIIINYFEVLLFNATNEEKRESFYKIQKSYYLGNCESQIYNNNVEQLNHYLAQYSSCSIIKKSNSWNGRNISDFLNQNKTSSKYYGSKIIKLLPQILLNGDEGTLNDMESFKKIYPFMNGTIINNIIQNRQVIESTLNISITILEYFFKHYQDLVYTDKNQYWECISNLKCLEYFENKMVFLKKTFLVDGSNRMIKIIKTKNSNIDKSNKNDNNNNNSSSSNSNSSSRSNSSSISILQEDQHQNQQEFEYVDIIDKLYRAINKPVLYHLKHNNFNFHHYSDLIIQYFNNGKNEKILNLFKEFNVTQKKAFDLTLAFDLDKSLNNQLINWIIDQCFKIDRDETINNNGGFVNVKRINENGALCKLNVEFKVQLFSNNTQDYIIFNANSNHLFQSLYLRELYKEIILLLYSETILLGELNVYQNNGYCNMEFFEAMVHLLIKFFNKPETDKKRNSIYYPLREWLYRFLINAALNNNITIFSFIESRYSFILNSNDGIFNQSQLSNIIKFKNFEFYLNNNNNNNNNNYDSTNNNNE